MDRDVLQLVLRLQRLHLRAEPCPSGWSKAEAMEIDNNDFWLHVNSPKKLLTLSCDVLRENGVQLPSDMVFPREVVYSVPAQKPSAQPKVVHSKGRKLRVQPFWLFARRNFGDQGLSPQELTSHADPYWRALSEDSREAWKAKARRMTAENREAGTPIHWF